MKSTIRSLIAKFTPLRGFLALSTIAMTSCATEDMEIFNQAFSQEFAPAFQQAVADNNALEQRLTNDIYTSDTYSSEPPENSAETGFPGAQSSYNSGVSEPAAATRAPSTEDKFLAKAAEMERSRPARTQTGNMTITAGGAAKFVGVYRESTGEQYSYLENSRIDTEDLASPSEYQTAISRFKNRHTETRKTYLLDQRRAALVYYFYSHAMGNPKNKIIVEHEVVYGNNLAEARANLNQRVAEWSALYQSQPTIVIRWGH